MEDLVNATERLIRAGYRDEFRAERGGLRALEADGLYEPESLLIDEVVRFEGTSDPDAQAAMFALRSKRDGIKGTFVVPYGLYMDPLDVEMVRRLEDDR